MTVIGEPHLAALLKKEPFSSRVDEVDAMENLARLL
jgi:hypothetical protein